MGKGVTKFRVSEKGMRAGLKLAELAEEAFAGMNLTTGETMGAVAVYSATAAYLNARPECRAEALAVLQMSIELVHGNHCRRRGDSQAVGRA